jgi:hypothetical protein
MSVPLFSTGRDPLEFSRDREDDVLLFTTDTRIWPTHNISEHGVRPTKTHPDATRPDLASSLNNLSASLADPRRREDSAGRHREGRPGLPGDWPPGDLMPTTTSRNDRCDLLTGSSTVKATHPRGNLRRDNGPSGIFT